MRARCPRLLAVLLIGFVSLSARASPELDRQYSLGTLGILRAWDNVDGLFGEIVTSAYKGYLSSQSRFVVQDLGKANDILGQAKIPYHKIIEDEAILLQLSKSFKIDSLLRTKVYKEGKRYRFVVDWLKSDGLRLLGTDTFTLDEPFGGHENEQTFRVALARSLARVIQQVPYLGTVTGRDQSSVTVNLGTSSGVRKGDTVVLATLDEVKIHPLTKSIVEWRLSPTGKATVDDVDEGMAFAKIEVEEYGRQIARFQKVVQILPGKEAPVEITRGSDELDRAKALSEPPRLGWIAPGILLGSYSRDATSASGTTGKNGSGTLIGFKADGQLWLTSEWFGELNFAYGSAGYSHKDVATGVESSGLGSAQMTQIRLGGGYMYAITPDFFGPKVWAKFGFQSTSWSLPTNAAERLSPSGVSSLTLGVGGDLPIRDDYGAMLAVALGLFPSGSEEAEYFGTPSGASHVNFMLAGYLWLQPRMKLRVGLDFNASSIDFVNDSSLSNKTIAFGPSLLFYF